MGSGGAGTARAAGEGAVMVAEPKARVAWSPRGNLAQMRLLKCQVFEIFFGGARGGGKTDGVLGEFGAHASRYGKDAIGLMVRRTRAGLVETIERSREIYGPLGWKLNETEKMWRAPDGARLRFAYLEARCRCRYVPGPQLHASLCRGGREFPEPRPSVEINGHAALRRGRASRFTCHRKSGRSRASMGEGALYRSGAVEAYKQRLRASGSKELVRAWLDGDWSVAMGAFFDCWDNKRHVIEPFEVPKDWMRFRSMDWGSASPFSVGWWALVQDDYTVHGRVLPRGCMVRYREWYGMRRGEPNVGLKLHAEEAGRGILEREQGETISYGVLDPSAFKEDGGPSIAERIGVRRQGL